MSGDRRFAANAFDLNGAPDKVVEFFFDDKAPAISFVGVEEEFEGRSASGLGYLGCDRCQMARP